MKQKYIVPVLGILGAMIACGLFVWHALPAKKVAATKTAAPDPFIQAKLEQGKKANRLVTEKSPYLLRHAFDPVDWFSWSDTAFNKARAENKPIFLSIGYASCFACYTMQHDVFENIAIASQMNNTAINILVDREERPDIDRLYMSVLQTTSGTGGWPMSLFLTPDRKPFFGATFLTAPVFTAILNRVHDVWLHNPEKLAASGDTIASYAEELAGSKNVKADFSVLQKGYDAYKQLYDHEFGGFGTAPKFPHPMILQFLMRYAHRTGDKAAMEMSLNTLHQMAAGAIFDQAGYGFHRYSTDDQWRTPHFEKMLYDQALLAMCYLEAFQISHRDQDAQIAKTILAYVQREMLSPEGGFYGAVDAASGRDAKHPEDKAPGAYYLWTSAEIEEALSPDTARIFEYNFGIRPEGNTLRDPMNLLKNKNVLFRAHSDQETAEKFKKSEAEIHSLLADAMKIIYETRSKRPRPSIDDKMILSWNSLMISAYARASAILNDSAYLKTAERCQDFLEHKLIDPKSGHLLRRYRNGEARYDANLQDFSFYIQSLLDLYEASQDIRYVQHADELKNRMLELFQDTKQGGFFDTTEADQSLPVRSRETYDDSEPAGNSIAILDLLRLSQMTGDRNDRAAADRALQFFAERMTDQPEAMPQFLMALEFTLQKPVQIVIAGPTGDPSTSALLREVNSRYIPDRIILYADGGNGQTWLAARVPYLSAARMAGNKPTVYLCEDNVCRMPTSDPVALASLLNSRAFDKIKK